MPLNSRLPPDHTHARTSPVPAHDPSAFPRGPGVLPVPRRQRPRSRRPLRGLGWLPARGGARLQHRGRSGAAQPGCNPRAPRPAPVRAPPALTRAPAGQKRRRVAARPWAPGPDWWIGRRSGGSAEPRPAERRRRGSVTAPALACAVPRLGLPRGTLGAVGRRCRAATLAWGSVAAGWPFPSAGAGCMRGCRW